MTSKAGGSARESQVLAAVTSLVDSLLHDFDVVELLTQLSEHCVHLLNVASAGLLLADPAQNLHLMAATSERTRELELFQLQADEGPCLDCYATGQVVNVADLSMQAERWPRFVDAAAGIGFVSVHAVPLRAAGFVVGALGLFGTAAGELNEADLAVGQALAHIATVAILQERPPTPAAVLPQLRTALTSRVVVDQAKGFLRGRLGISLDEAFRLLRRYAHLSDQHLSEVARGLVSDRASRPTILAAMSQLPAER